MPKYRVDFWAKIPITVEVEADNKEDAKDYAVEGIRDSVDVLPAVIPAEEEVDYGPDGTALVILDDNDWLFDYSYVEEIE